MAHASAERLTSLIFTFHRLIREHTAGHGRIDPLSLMQLKVLSLVFEKGAPTMKEIADSLYITPPSATTAINYLVKDAQLKRAYDTRDRRIVRLELTGKGRKVFKKRRSEVIGRMDTLLGVLNTKEKASFVRVLSKVIDSYKR